MSIYIKEKTGSTCKLVFSDLDITIVNAIRRTLLSNIPTYALHTINIIKNTSNIDNDKISQRLQLIPVKDEISVSCSIKNDTTDLMHITSNSLTCTGWIYPEILIVTLLPDQELTFNATSSKGIAHDHVKWCNITDLSFSQHTRVLFNNEPILPNTLVNTEAFDTSVLQERLPKLFKNNMLIANKLLIDFNLITDINEIMNNEIIVIEELPIWDMSFTTINGFDPIDTINIAINQLVSECKNCDYTLHSNGNIVNLKHGYSIVYMIIYQYKQYFRYNISGKKIHPLDEFLTIKSNSPTFAQDFKLCLIYLEQSLQSLQIL